MQQLLAVIDHGEAAQRVVRVAARWAQRSGAQLSVFLPVALSMPKGLELGPGLLATVEHTSEMEAMDWLQSFLEQHQVAAAQHAAASRHWVRAIQHEVERMQPDLVFIAPGVAPKAGCWKQLMRQLARPTYIVHQDGEPKNFRVALSCLPDDAPHRLLNDALLGWGQRLARLWQGDLWVSSALPSPLEMAPMVGETYAASYVEASMQDALRQGLEELLQRHGVPVQRLMTGIGSIEAVLVQQQAQQAVDCLLVGTVARSALSAFLVGNSAEVLEKRLPCDLLLLHPQDLEDD